MPARYEELGVVEASLRDLIPGRFAEGEGVYFALPEDFEAVALGVVGEARQANQGVLTGSRWMDDFFDEVRA